MDKKLYKSTFQACTKYYSDILCGRYSFKEMKFMEAIRDSSVDINGAMIFSKEVWLKELKPALNDSVRFDIDTLKE